MEEMAPIPSSSGSTDVECDVCIGSKRKAEQACMECVASYCDIHLDLHNTLHGGKRHRLIEPNVTLHQNICPDHEKILEVYCRTDRLCICHLCITGKHRGHDVIAMEEEVSYTQNKLDELHQQAVHLIEEKEKDVEELRQAVEVFLVSAQEAQEVNEMAFASLLQSVMDSKNKVTELIQGQIKTAVTQAEGFIESLLQEISSLRCADADLQHLEMLSSGGNDIRFLESSVKMPSFNKYKKSFALLVQPCSSFQELSVEVTDLMDDLDRTITWKLFTISGRDATKLSFNINTAHKSLCLTKEESEVTALSRLQDYPCHAERFDSRPQILCSEALTGSQYWEVEIGGNAWICIAVSFKGICRKVKHGPLFGKNTFSWGLRCYRAKIEFWHANKILVEKNMSCGSKVGVYLDHSAGILAFYSVSESMSLIYQHQAAFDEPLYPGFGLAGKNTYVRLCNDIVIKNETDSFSSNL